MEIRQGPRGPGAKGDCMRCGFTYRLTQIRKEWTGARVCPECWDRKPEILRAPPVRPEGLPKPNASPEVPPHYVAINEITRDDL